MHISHKRALAVALAGIGLFALLGAAKCDGAQHGPGSGESAPSVLKACATEILGLPDTAAGNKVIVKTKSECDKPPNAHSVLITLLFHPRGATQFVKVAVHQCPGIPLPGHPINCKATEVPCRQGIWQVKVLVTYSMNIGDGGDFAYTPDQSGESTYISKCNLHSK